jgi:hypothetical protein
MMKKKKAEIVNRSGKETPFHRGQSAQFDGSDLP